MLWIRPIQLYRPTRLPAIVLYCSFELLLATVGIMLMAIENLSSGSSSYLMRLSQNPLTLWASHVQHTTRFESALCVELFAELKRKSAEHIFRLISGLCRNYAKKFWPPKFGWLQKNSVDSSVGCCIMHRPTQKGPCCLIYSSASPHPQNMWFNFVVDLYAVGRLSVEKSITLQNENVKIMI